MNAGLPPFSHNPLTGQFGGAVKATILWGVFTAAPFVLAFYVGPRLTTANEGWRMDMAVALFGGALVVVLMLAVYFFGVRSLCVFVCFYMPRGVCVCVCVCVVQSQGLQGRTEPCCRTRTRRKQCSDVIRG